ncbi:MAG: nucleotidyl transferase AbiEii/AbiGii toxin family protein [Chitinispirillia bacterium]|nr:nucleotidyl transferase AbiEii/AbiGii toxin family protein [Chitinispirillia bacterium]MCL2267590.1 nucleotidyl transferase AbiEii/AbiGii toxin family protein [Chitinispirillia bacterium]
MTVKNLKDVAASVRQRLLNKSKAENRMFDEIVRRYAMERFLYRLGMSEYRERLILKGALMFAVWKNSIYRPTLDIDMLGLISNDATTLEECICDICSLKTEDDGIIFDTSTVRSSAITKDADYVGRRVRFTGKMENMRIAMQIDIGFGDAVYPKPDKITMPSFIDMPLAQILGYTKESAIAEKYHAMVQMAELNSRMKDFYDIWVLSRTFDFSGHTLAEAIKATFNRRGTPIADDMVMFTESFARDKQDQWRMFRKKIGAVELPESFFEVMSQIKKFLLPVISYLAGGTKEPENWKVPDMWIFGL